MATEFVNVSIEKLVSCQKNSRIINAHELNSMTALITLLITYLND